MTAFITSTLTLLLLLAGSCSFTSPPGESKGSSSPRDIKAPWSIDFKTFGGFVGVGKGNITIDSAAKFVCSSNNRGESVKGATGTLNPSQFEPVSQAVAKLDPKGWKIPGLNVTASDAFGYKLEVISGGDSRGANSVQWYDNTADQLPDDLKRLDAVLEETMKKHCSAL